MHHDATVSLILTVHPACLAVTPGLQDGKLYYKNDTDLTNPFRVIEPLLGPNNSISAAAKGNAFSSEISMTHRDSQKTFKIALMTLMVGRSCSTDICHDMTSEYFGKLKPCKAMANSDDRWVLSKTLGAHIQR